MTCGATCQKSAQICLQVCNQTHLICVILTYSCHSSFVQGFEYILKDAVNQSIVMNRTLHETIIAEIMEPYLNLAMSTAIISKLAQ